MISAHQLGLIVNRANFLLGCQPNPNNLFAMRA